MNVVVCVTLLNIREPRNPKLHMLTVQVSSISSLGPLGRSIPIQFDVGTEAARKKQVRDPFRALAIANPSSPEPSSFFLQSPHNSCHYFPTQSILTTTKIRMLAVRSIAAPVRRQCFQASARAWVPTSVQVSSSLRPGTCEQSHWNHMLIHVSI